jgi:hypothetical protein
MMSTGMAAELVTAEPAFPWQRFSSEAVGALQEGARWNNAGVYARL